MPLHAAATQHAALPAPNAAPKKNISSSVLPVGAKCDTRRAFLQGVMIAAAGAGTLLGAVDAAPAASKRRAPPPAEEKEKKDPNLSGVQAKVLASRKRKEAMKEAMAKMREKGKPAATVTEKEKSVGAVVE